MTAPAPAEDRISELIHEVRNLTAQISLLHTIFVKRRVLYLFLLIELAIITIVVGTLFFIVSNHHAQENRLVIKLTESCHIRNQTTLGTHNLIHTMLTINQEQIRLNPHLSPDQKKLEIEYTKALTTWENSLPEAPVNCQGLGD